MLSNPIKVYVLKSISLNTSQLPYNRLFNIGPQLSILDSFSYINYTLYSEYLSLNNADPKNSDKRGSSVYFEYLMILLFAGGNKTLCALI